MKKVNNRHYRYYTAEILCVGLCVLSQGSRRVQRASWLVGALDQVTWGHCATRGCGLLASWHPNNERVNHSWSGF